MRSFRSSFSAPSLRHHQNGVVRYKYNDVPNRAIVDYIRNRPGIFELTTRLCDLFGPNATYAPNGYHRRA